MKSDINIPAVSGVTVAIARRPAEDHVFTFDLEDIIESNGEIAVDPNDGWDWFVYLLNDSDHPIRNVLITSKGYGTDTLADVRTAVLRQHIELVASHSSVVLERIEPEVFPLLNEFWVSYYKADESQIYDKRFIFLPDSIHPAHLQPIPLLALEGVLHD
jgi:hypothetical protein